MPFLVSNNNIKRNTPNSYVVEFPLNDELNKNAIIVAFERLKFRDNTILTTDNSMEIIPSVDQMYGEIEGIQFLPDRIKVFIDLIDSPMGLLVKQFLDDDIKSLRFQCKCTGNVNELKVTDVYIIDIIPERNPTDDLLSNSSL
jgi:hypothetical protein